MSQADKPSVDGLIDLAKTCGATVYRNRHLPTEPAIAFGNESWAKFCAALAGPLEQPQEPTSDKSYPVVAVGKDLPPAPSVQSAFKRIRACGDEFTAYKMLLELLDRAACEAVAGSAGSDEKASAPESSLSVPKEQQ